MTVRIPMTLESLGRTRFAASAAVETVGTIGAHTTTPGAPHVAGWRDRAVRRVSDEDLRLLIGIADASAPYVPDFLMPPPPVPVHEIDDAAEAIAATDPDEIDYHLDITFQDRPIRPHVAALFGGREGMERQRRPMPPSVRAALRDGPAGLAGRVAEAMVRYFQATLAPDWPRVRELLRADIAHRGVRIAERGPAATVDDIDPKVAWRVDAVELERPLDMTIDWAYDGLLLVPTTTRLTGTVMCAEEPMPPMIIYPARAIGVLWGETDATGDAELIDLIGHTRAALLKQLAEPCTTGELSRRVGLTPGTVSYHLGILRRAGLIRRTRRGPRVVYERSDRAGLLPDGRA